MLPEKLISGNILVTIGNNFWGLILVTVGVFGYQKLLPHLVTVHPELVTLLPDLVTFLVMNVTRFGNTCNQFW